jgi:hypothetical protein
MTSISGTLRLAQEEPAAGAPIEDLVIGGIVTLLMVAVLIVFAFAHKAGKAKFLSHLGAFSSRLTGMPPWVGVPMAITGASLLTAVFGFYWDVSIHIDNGRDPGPFANASHFLIIFGLAGIALAGFVSILLGTTERNAASVRLPSGWRAPVGGVLLFVCGGIAVLGFPLDDVWHRLFGQDVTLWSPTHIQMVGGASLSTLALWILLREGMMSSQGKVKEWVVRYGEPSVVGAFLLGLSALQAEFDFSVPQFRMLYHPILLLLCAGTGLVAARLRLGRGGALKAVAMFLLVRGILSFIIGPILGHTTLHFPLYLVEALAVEGVALVAGTSNRLRFGVLSGLAIGTFGFAGEWIWSQIWMIAPWKTSLLPEAFVFGLVAAMAGSLTGTFIAKCLTGREGPSFTFPRPLGIATAAAVFVCLFYPLATNHSVDATANISLDRSSDGTADVRLALQPPDIADDAEFFNITSWQGGGSVVQEPQRVGSGVYEFEDPIPVSGDWKTLIRMQKGASLMAVPVYLPQDPAIPAPEVPAEANMQRPFTSDKEIVLREAKDVSGGLVYGASGAIAAIAVVWVLVIGWGLLRLEGRGPRARSGVPATA